MIARDETRKFASDISFRNRGCKPPVATITASDKHRSSCMKAAAAFLTGKYPSAKQAAESVGVLGPNV
jgi:hypothetical protein